MTYPHYDSHAFGTVIRIVKGCKYWVFDYCPATATATTLDEFDESMAAHKGTEQVFTEDAVDRYLVVAEAGDIL